MSDRYDKHIEELLAINPGQWQHKLLSHWTHGQPLFDYICGSCCPTMVKGGFSDKGLDEHLEAEIRASQLIPDDPRDIAQSSEVLTEFARIQRMADTIGRPK